MPVFELNLADFLNYKRMLKRASKLYSRAGGHVLNSAAFGTRKLAIRNIKKEMIARNERFIQGSVRVEKARIGAPLDMQRATVGSIKRDRFSGWREQEGGQQTKREHQAWPAARRGGKKHPVIRVARLRRNFLKPTAFGGRNPIERVIRMLHTLSANNYRKPFIIFDLERRRGGKPAPPGLYRFGPGPHPNRRLELLQRFKSPKPTKRKPWLIPAREEYVRRVNLRTVWGRALERELKKTGMYR